MDLSILNPAQRQAVTTQHPRALVIAGAGSGKTKTLAHRIAALMMSGVPAQRILAITFTRAAAREMRDRVAALLADEGKWSGTLPEIRTMHSWAARMLRQHAPAIGRTADFSIYDERDKADIVRAVAFERGMKNAATARFSTLWKDPVIVRLYEERLQEGNALDYDMIETKALELLGSDANKNAWHARYDHVFVDEFQDTSLVQVLLVNAIFPRHLFVVGDPRQSIYRFRGAEPATIIGWAADAAFEVIDLTINYRSKPNVVDLANAVIAGAPETWTPMTSARPAGDPVVYLAAENEALCIGTLLRQAHDKGTPWRDMAVLGRMWGDADTYDSRRGLARIRDVLETMEIPVNYTGGSTDPWNTDDGRALARWIRLVANPNDVNLASMLAEWGASMGGRRRFTSSQLGSLRATSIRERRPLVAVMAEQDPEWRVAWRPVVELLAYHEALARPQMIAAIGIDHLVQPTYERAGLASRLDDLMTLWGELAQWAELGDFCEWWTDRSSQERIKADADAVTITTVHGAKGLEWPVVVVAGCDNGNFPSPMAKSEDDREEDRRVLYVAITRARDQLFLTMSPETRTSWGKREPRVQSPFLAAVSGAPPLTELGGDDEPL